MVVGPLSGEEIDFPNTPALNEEFQAPNKFVYEWVGDRWKNIHRPLIISDYIWPDPEDGTPLDPDGGGGDDWTREAINLAVGGSSYNYQGVVDIKIDETANYVDPVHGPAPLIYNVQDRPDEDIYDWPLEWVVTYENALGVRKTFQRVSGNSFTTTQYFNLDIGPENRVAFQIPRSFWGNPDKMHECSVRVTASARQWDYSGTSIYVPGFQDTWTLTYNTLSNGSSYKSGGGGTFNLTISEPSNPNVVWDSVIDGSPLVEADSPLVGSWVFQYRLDPGIEVYDVSVDIFDPYGPKDPNFIPVGFATERTMTHSLAAFNGDSDNAELLHARHGNPFRLDATQYVSREDTTTNMLSITTGLSESVEFGSLHLVDGGGAFVGYRTDDNTVEYRYLGTPYDYTSHSFVVDDATAYDSFQNYSKKSAALTGTVEEIAMDPTGTYLFTLEDNEIRRYTLSAAWDVSTLDPATYQSFDVSGFDPDTFALYSGGNAIVLAKTGFMKQIILDTVWDLTTAVLSSFERAFDIENPVGLNVSDDGLTMIMVNNPSDVDSPYQIVQYTRNVD